MAAQPFIVEEYVRWSDVDFAGIIFYGAYVRFFEIAETEMFRAAGFAYGDFYQRYDIWLPRAHLDCDFKHPARLDDRLRVAAYFTRFGTSSIGLNFDVAVAGRNVLAAVAHEVLVCTDRQTLKPRPLPADLRTRLGAYHCTVAEARSALGL